MKSEWPWLWPFKVTQGQMWWCHWTLHIWFSMIYIYSNHMSLSLLALMATQNVFSYLLSLGPNYEKSRVHWLTPKWPWMPQNQRYTIYVEILPTSPNFSPFCSTTARFPDTWGFWFLHYKVQWWTWNFRKKFVKNQKLKILKIPKVLWWEPLGGKFRNPCDL